MINPTGQKIRSDLAGSGEYGALRGNRKHRGTDYLCTPGQDVVAPVSGIVVRTADPYGDGEFSGVVIEGPSITVKMFYLKLDHALLGRCVAAGQRVGAAQNIANRYGGDMKPHVHLEVIGINPDLLVRLP